ncbi:MAG: FAD-dependent oxidoreductase, partial [Eggerthella lenta]
MDGGPVAKLSIAPRSRDDARIAAHLDTFARRVEATPPGMCPLAVQLTMLQASGAQTCGKCVPCRDGIPQLAAMLKRVVDCDADEGVLEGLRALAEMIRDTSDCAIGYEAARSVLEGLDTFADEYASHLRDRSCQEGVGQTVPCETLCPAHVDVPAYIALTAAGDYAGAVNMVRKDNPFPTACAFVCEHPCETRCRRTLIDAPINIRGIKKFAVDQMPADQVAPPPRSVDTARTVAVIGGGPSGLTCAYFLALMGHRVTVFEERAQLGGMLRYGIPAYRFPRERLDEDIRGILNAGTITARCGEAVGAHEMAEIADTYHAVYVSIGAQTGKSLRIDGVDAEGVVSAVDLLGAIGDGDYPDFTGKRVVVVGGGNVAMDCARTSVRAGADEVSVVYRRRKDDMTALPAEVESAIAEGVEMIVLEAP